MCISKRQVPLSDAEACVDVDLVFVVVVLFMIH